MRRRMFRVAGLTLPLIVAVAIGSVIAVTIGDDIHTAWRGGHVASGGTPVPYEFRPSASQADEHADAYGFAMGQQTGAQRDTDCGRLAEPFRRGCRGYLRWRAEQPAAIEAGDPIAAAASDRPRR
jgi:hypothetical protein